MKNKIIILFLLLLFTCGMAQQVTIKGKDFYMGNEKFYPVVMNFSVNVVNNNGNYYLSADHGYGPTNFYECSNTIDCSAQLLEHFNYLASIGFNTVRIVGLNPHYRPKYTSLDGLNFLVKNPLSPIGNSWIHLELSNPSDPTLLTALSAYDKILELADAASLKVILLMKGEKTHWDDTEVELRKTFLEVVASHLHNSNYSSALLAYDLVNEPDYHIEFDNVITFPKTKQQACEIISTWYDAVKTNAPHHLVTIGNCGMDDIFSFDPSILKVDFNSLHYYPRFKPYENKADPNTQELARQRTLNDLYWFNQASIVPWIVGETGFRARATPGNHEMDGTLNDMGDFVTYSLNSVCNCGGSGYSWWQYQDLNWGVWGGCSFGLLEHGAVPPTAEKQPAVDNFRNYVPGVTGICPVDKSDLFDETKTYYNLYKYTAPDNLKLTRHVVDQDGTPIRDAVVRVATFLGKDSVVMIINGMPKDTTVDRWSAYYTHTDVNGKFIAIPCTTQYGFTGKPQNIIPEIHDLRISAAGAEVKSYDNNIWVIIPDTIKLNKIKDNVIVSGETVLSGHVKIYKGRKSLTVLNTTVNPGAWVDFTSQKSITLLSGFTASAGSSIVNIYIAPPDCNDLAFQSSKKSISLVPKNNIPEIEKPEELKEIMLSFENNTFKNYISVFPNPANGTVTIQFYSNITDASLSHIKLYDIFGRTIFTISPNCTSYLLDVSKYSKGVYFIEAKDKTSTYY
ncbi:MAG: T9SS type A sorting domain-containing protein [Bacteroidetes bacterium]|nr:T9SS type A sorting domain-containing protein [Bacteroidota bacterium]MCL2301923.1 T9SS type A sorting domain-containing protein [Lentimicrobiaceae bacterium]